MVAAKPIPDGDAAVTLYLIVSDAAAAIGFCKEAFGTAKRMRLIRPDGRHRAARRSCCTSALPTWTG
ncbi:MAG TPA: hypothetical protein VMF05_02965 [Stellaceae bacterium]|nr:hypothetical protein [Stellaceae bacterium]